MDLCRLYLYRVELEMFLFPASDGRVNIAHRDPFYEESRVPSHEKKGELLEQVSDCLVLVLTRLSCQSLT